MRNDVDNNGRKNDLVADEMFTYSVGGRMQFGNFGMGATVSGQIYNLVDGNNESEISFTTYRAGAAYSFLRNSLVLGLGARVIEFDVANPGPELENENLIKFEGAGIETGALMAMHFADEALVVTNPEVSSVRDSDRILGMLSSKTRRAIEGKEPVKEHLLITRYNPNRVDQGQMLSLEDIQDILRIPLIGVIPESENVLQASNHGTPAIHLKGTDVSEAYMDVVARFLGEDKPLRFVDPQKAGFLKRLFGGK